MKTNKFWSILMMFVLVLGTTIIFSSCSKDDDDENSFENISKESIENTLWRANTTFVDPLISSDFIDLEIQETRIFFGTDENALVCIKYKNVDTVIGYESGEMINYAHYEIVNDTLNVVTYKDNGAVEGRYRFTIKKGALVDGNMVVKKVRSFNADDEKYFEDKMLYYGPDDVRYNFDISVALTPQRNSVWRGESGEYYLYVDAVFSVDKEQKLDKRGFTEIVAEYSYYSTADRKRYEYQVSRAVSETGETTGYKELFLTKRYSSDKVVVSVSFKVWDHKRNVYKYLPNSTSFEF